MKKICFLCLLSIFYVSKIQSNLIASVIQDSVITNIIETVEEPQPVLSGKIYSKGNGGSLLEVKNKPELNSDLEDLIIDVPLDLDLYSDNLNYLYPHNKINFEYDYEPSMLFSFDDINLMRDESFQNDSEGDFAFSERDLNLQDMNVSVLDILPIKDSELPKIEESVVLSSLLDIEDSILLPIPEIEGVISPEVLTEIEGFAALPESKSILPITTNPKLIHINPSSKLSKIASKIRKMMPPIKSNPYADLNYRDIMQLGLNTDDYDDSSDAFGVINENLKTYTQRDKLISYFDTYADLAELHIFLDPLEDRDITFMVNVHKGLSELNLFPTHEIKTLFATNNQNQVFAEFILTDVDCKVDHALKLRGLIAYNTCISKPSSQQIDANRKGKLAEINKILNENAQKRAEKSN